MLLQQALDLKTATDFLLWGIVLHLIADWLLQNEAMATHKTSLRHPLAYVHSGIHLIANLILFPPLVALGIAFLHLLIDTRKPLAWWRKKFQQTLEGPMAPHVSIWTDQVAHVAVLATAAWMTVHIL